MLLVVRFRYALTNYYETNVSSMAFKFTIVYCHAIVECTAIVCCELHSTSTFHYEIETRSNPKHTRDRAKQYQRIGIDVIVIPIKKLPKDISQREKALKEYIWE